MEIIVAIFVVLLLGSIPWTIWSNSFRKVIECSICHNKAARDDVALTTNGEWGCFKCFREGNSKVMV